MIEKYNTLSLVQLKAIVKAQGIKNTSSMRKAQLVQILSDLEEQQNAKTSAGSAAPEAAQKTDARPEPTAAQSKPAGGKAERTAGEAASSAVSGRGDTPGSVLDYGKSEVNSASDAQTGGAQSGAVQAGAGQRSTAQSGAAQAGSTQHGAVQNSAAKSSTQQTAASAESAGTRENSSYQRNQRGTVTRTGRVMRTAQQFANGRRDTRTNYNQRSSYRQNVDSDSSSDTRESVRQDGAAYGSDYGSRSDGNSRNDYNNRNDSGNRSDYGTSRNDSGNRSDYGTSRNDSTNRSDYGNRSDSDNHMEPSLEELDSGQMAHGILEVMPDGFGFIRCENYLPGENDIYVSPAQIRRFNLKTGDIIEGHIKIKLPTEKFSALLFVKAVNGFHPAEASKRKNFEDMTPIFPNSRIRLETERASVPMRIVDLVSPIGKGQRGMIVAPPKTGKTTLLKQIAKSVHANHPDMNMIILLIDERPEEVTDIKEYIEGENVEVIYSTFDELPEHHKRVSEMVLERAKRLVEHKKDVVILLDSITRLARAYNLTVPPSGRTLSGGLDPAALHMPKRFFGAARNMREGGSLTVLATALVETGSKMDDVVFEEFKGTGNMELVLDRRLSEKRIFPAIDIARSGTRREELLLSKEELEAAYLVRKALGGMKSDEALERILEMFMRTRSNKDFIAAVKRTKFIQ